MRVKRWTLPTRARPPDPPRPPRRPHPPPPPSRPQPRSILDAQKSARQRADSQAWGHFFPPASPKSRNSTRFLTSTLSQLPPISAPPRLNLRPLEDLESQLATWRKACFLAHSALSGPLAGSKDVLQHRVAKVVGHTMRILLRLGQVEAAKELDRAFFSTETGRKRGKRRATEGELAAAEEGGEASEGAAEERHFVERWAQLDGLGLARGDIRLAWMSSFAVRLEEAVQGEDDAALLEFGSLLKLMYLQLGEQAARQDACLMAFLTRKMGVVQEKLTTRRVATGGDNGPGKQASLEETKEQVRRLLLNIKDAEADEVEVVSFALLETALERLERVKGNALEDPFFHKVEEDIQRLVGSLEASTDFRALHNLLLSFTSSVDRHAHILHLAIRFLLLRHRYHDPSHPSSTHSPTPLQSAVQLYSLLLDLTPRLPSSPSYDELSSLRQRQSSALYRILAAHVSTAASSPPPLLASLASQALDLIDVSLSSLTAFLSSASASPAPPSSPSNTPASPHPRLLGISTRLFRRLLFSLTSSVPPTSPPSDHAAVQGQGRYVPAVPWRLVSRAMKTMIRAKEYDAAFSHSAGAQPAREALLEHEKPLFVQPNFAHQMVRAALMGGMAEGDLREDWEDQTPLSRLSALLEFAAGLERVSPLLLSPTSVSSFSLFPDKGTPAVEDSMGLGERRARPLLLRAVQYIIEQEWRGSAAVEWRKEVLDVVERWAREGRDWEGVRRVVAAREDGKGKDWGVTIEEAKDGRRTAGKKKARKIMVCFSIPSLFFLDQPDPPAPHQTQSSRPSLHTSLVDQSSSPNRPTKPASSASSVSPAPSPAEPSPPFSAPDSAASPAPSPMPPPLATSRAIGRRGKPAFFHPSTPSTSP
ncbi:hypothetical protein JCM11251_006472 [Rhodosporidiobolus azoricus]